MRHIALHRTSNSGVKIRLVFKKLYLFYVVEDAASLYWENNYNL